ncbi:hypothetical protein [Sulfurivirga sp.]|uniref:hypothetical protein n=1 Tax=Sulfurivirga sp. TaxID=2614236 RepID=UPI0025D2E48C|nr:hypothetical protein [Sulfurivirga sp.]
MKRPFTPRNFTVVDSPEKAISLMREAADSRREGWCVGVHPYGYMVMRRRWAAAQGLRWIVAYTPRSATEESE